MLPGRALQGNTSNPARPPKDADAYFRIAFTAPRVWLTWSAGDSAE